MKCYYHPEKDAEAQCSLCGAFICSDCAIKIKDKIYCKQCLYSNAQAYITNSLKVFKKKNKIVMVVSTLFFAFCTCIFFLISPFSKVEDVLTMIIFSMLFFLFAIISSVLFAESCNITLFIKDKWESWRAKSSTIYIVPIWILLLLKIIKFVIFINMPFYICTGTLGIWPAYSFVHRQIKISKLKKELKNLGN